jgi:hypothetical protein
MRRRRSVRRAAAVVAAAASGVRASQPSMRGAAGAAGGVQWV